MTRKNKRLTNYNTDIFGKVAFGAICPEVVDAPITNRKSFNAYTDKELMTLEYSRSMFKMFGKNWECFLDDCGTYDYYNAHFILEKVGL